MTDRMINKWLRKEFSVLGWVLMGYYVLMNVLVTVQAAVDAAKQVLKNISSGAFPFDVNMDVLLSNGWGYFAAMVTGLVILWGWKGSDYWKEEMFAREKRMTFSVFFCGSVLFMGAQMVSGIWLTLLELVMNLFGSSVMTKLESVSGSTDTLSMFLYSGLWAPLAEEILFRGYVLRSLRPYGKRFAILGSALLFALFHGNLLQGPYAFLAGLVLGYFACEYSIRWAIALHIFNNLVLADLLSRVMQKMPVIMADMLHISLFGTAAAVSVGILIAKRQEIKAYAQREWIDSRCVKCLLTSSGIMVFTGLMLISMILWML